ncbi:thioredoxin [Candidatus Dependentiae bacterium]
MAIISIKEDNHKKEIEESKKPVVLDVYAPWCGPCQHMMPIIEELEKEIGDKYTFAKINVDEARELSIKYGVSSVPTFVFIKDNEVKGKETGYMSKDDLKAKIESYLG